ncbi:hypothetical protein FQZ97_945910 [compost metagenome]
MEGNDVGPSGGHTGQANGSLYSFRPGGGIEDAVQPRGQVFSQFFRELKQGLVHHGGVLGVDNLSYLLPGGGHDVGVAVTGAGNADSGGEIEVLLAVGCVDPAAQGVVDDDRRRLLEDGAKSCHGLILS